MMNHFNWTKTRKEARRLFYAYFDAVREYQQKEQELKDMEESIPKEHLEKMKDESAKRGAEQYLSSTIQAPSKTKILRTIRNAEEAEARRTHLISSHSEAMFINNAIDLADLQYQVKVQTIEAEPNPGGDGQIRTLLLKEERLRNRLDEHFSTLLRVAPALQEANLIRGQPPTLQKRYLPSDFSPKQREQYQLENLASKEIKIQVAEAYDALRRLRNALGLKALLIQSKKTHIRGYKNVGKARASINTAEKGVQREAEAYKRARQALISLEVNIGPDSEVGHLQPLLEGDLVPLREFTTDRRFVPSDQETSWIWKSLGGRGTYAEAEDEVLKTVSSWNDEVVRLAWVHAQATRDRWWEEMVLLKEELRRVGASFSYRVMEWQSAADAAYGTGETRVTRGVKAYSLRQAATYQFLADDARNRYKDATGPYKPKLFASRGSIQA
ncbi:hypothetical protein FRC00_010506 [Tulasnella sp. 408]|nr:hypothetical protein FRC00_010506 [Tulasnella sp. 408]